MAGVTDVISGESAVGEPSGGLVVEKIPSIRRKVAPKHGRNEVVISGVDCGVSEH